MTRARKQGRFLPRLAAVFAAAGVWLAVFASPLGAKTQTAVRVTSGDHVSYGRVVLDAPGMTYAVSRDGTHLTVHFVDEPSIGALPALPPNVTALRAVPGGVELTLAPGATVFERRMGAKVVIDVEKPQTPGGPAAEPRARTLPRPAGDAAKTERIEPGKADITKPADARPPPAPSPVPPPALAHIPPPAPPPVPPPAVPRQNPAIPRQNPAIPGVNRPTEATRPPPAVVATTQALAPGQGPGQTLSQAPAIAPPTPPAPPPVTASVASAPTASTPAGPPSPGEPPTPNASEPTQSWPITRDPVPNGPVGIAAFRARPPGDLVGAAIQVPFAPRVGAALFTRGPETFVVFDERRPIDLSALRDDPVFGSAVTSIYPSATVIRLTPPAGQSVLLSNASLGWRLSVVAAQPRPAALVPVVTPDGLVIAATTPAQVVTIPDPQTGATLMIGTQRAAGQGVAVERRTAEFQLPVTGQGVVVMPMSELIGLRITQAGFVLSGGAGGLILSPPPPMPEATLAAASLTRLFEFPRQSTADLEWRAKQQAVAAAEASPGLRGPFRHNLAESLLGLGEGVEAQTLLHIAMKDDPREAASPAAIGLAAIAALLAGRPNEAADLADPRLNGTDEIALWRAIQIAMADHSSPKAAAVLATTAPLLFTYPAELRRRVLPLALETMIRGGEADAAEPLLAQREHDPSLAFARALLLQARGHDEAALAAYDALANSRSPLDHARAAIRAIELRLSMGKLDAKAAADAMEARLYAWRGDERDLALRLRIADLRRKAGQWRGVFAQLRAARAAFPAQAPEIDRRLKEAFAAVPRDPALGSMPPAELIALLDENAELMADGPDGEQLRILLARKLMALDLPKQADPLLTKLMRAAPDGPSRAGFGATLATLRLNEGDGDGALLALSESNTSDMPDPVRDRRALIIARVEAKRGHVDTAVEALAGTNSVEADETRAAILEQASDWPGARDALMTLAARVVPASGPLDDAQDQVVLRLATAAARAGDDATLAGLREKLGARIGTGPRADLIRLLTAAPVRGTADLGRARAEMGLARAITADIDGKKPGTTTP